ncbi:hypothetical protein N0V88_007866 [Collariella sp. IMI 366227]|nr:hypothetical protein N0V88_007866 [Collariella sp. IMI 366227]
MWLPTAVALLAVGARTTLGSEMAHMGSFKIRGIDTSMFPMDISAFPIVDAATVSQPDLSDANVVKMLEEQWWEATQRNPSGLNQCPVSCSTAGSDSGRWDLYPDVPRMAACNETMLFKMAVDTDLTPAGLRVCTADLEKGAQPGSNNNEICAPALEAEVSSSLRLATTGTQPAAAATKPGIAASLRQISNHIGSIAPSCNNDTLAFAHAGNAIVGLYVGSQVHRQGIATKVLERVLARVEGEGISESLVVEMCEPDAEYGADYVVGVIVVSSHTDTSVGKVQQSVRQWSKGSCQTSGGQTLAGEKVKLLVPAPAALSTVNPTDDSASDFSTQGKRDGGAMFGRHSHLRREEYCSNVKSVVKDNTCTTIADKRCTISLDTFLSYNPGIKCDALQIGQKVCCTPGKVPPPDPVVPEPVPYCTNWKTVVDGNTCPTIADKRCTVSLDTFKARNPQLDCNNLKPGQTFCCNEGRVPPANECSNSKTVVKDNTCLTIADKRCTISLAKFIEYNPQLNCNSLKIGEPFCCNEGRVPPPGPAPNADGTCKTGTVAQGDGCASLASKCGIPGDYLTLFNTQTNFCSTLQGGQVYCCGRGKLPDLRPKKNADGSCFSYTVKAGDSCNAIAIPHQLTVADVNKFNAKTWGWKGCTGLQPDQKICLSDGDVPMPAPVANAVCGPTVPGTKRPATGTDIAKLNPCPLNVCCNHWGQCGMTKDFCEVKKSETGAPGTTMCVSNCGTDIIRSTPPESQIRIAYFGAWNEIRPCLNLHVDQIDTSKYTHIHFAFADLTSTFQVDVSKVQAEFDRFKGMTGVKKIISFGGWDFSTMPGTYKILRDAVKAQNRATFRDNVVNFVNTHNLDGVDLDWEYPGAPDIPTIPAGDASEGRDYATWLRNVRDTLPKSKSVSFAAPASYWYLKAFPVSTIASFIDYVVYMTYDLHGQWDLGSRWAMDGCEGGNCLRSHVNMTETLGALSMITKAGMPSNKIAVGVTSYGRSFRMATKNCVDPICTFTGTNRESQAAAGRCTGTKGYISNAELDEIIQTNTSVKTWSKDMTDYIVYNDYEWVAYMSDSNKQARSLLYELLAMRGTSDWSVDLQSFDGDSNYFNDPDEPVWVCAPLSFDSMAALEETKDSFPAHCMNSYVLEVLAKVLEGVLNDYEEIMRTDYDKKFGYFADAVRHSWDTTMRAWYSDDNMDDWFNCYQTDGSSHEQIDCPPHNTDVPAGYQINMEIKDKDKLNAHLDEKFGILLEYTYPAIIDRIDPLSCPPRGPDLPPAPACLNYGKITGVLMIPGDLDIPDPKDAIAMSLDNLRKLVPHLRDVAHWSRLNALLDEVNTADVIDTAATPIYMAESAIDGMRKAYDIGAEAEKKERENIIMWVLSAILFIIPGAGQALSAVTRIAMFARIASITAYTGGVAMSAYEIANNPDNLGLAIFFLLIDLIPGVGKQAKGTWHDGSVLRGRMTPDVIDKLGPFVKNGLEGVDKVIQSCRVGR